MSTANSTTHLLSAPRTVEWSADVGDRLRATLAGHDVRIEALDGWTIRCLGVPISDLFTKPRTNLLLRRLTAKAGSSVYVDSDLAYHGPDPTLRLALTGPTRRKWRRLRTPPVPGTAGEALCSVLRLLDSPLADHASGALANLELNESAKSAATGRGWMAGMTITPAMVAATHEESFRKSLARQLAVLTTRSTVPRSALLWGRPGCGRDHLMLAAMHSLFESGRVSQVCQLSAASLVAGCILPQEVDSLLASVLAEATATDGSVLLVRDLDLCVTRSPVSSALLCDAFDRGLRLLATVRSAMFLNRVASDEALARRLLVIEVPPFSRSQTVAAVQRLAESTDLEVAPAAIQAAIHISDEQTTAQPAAAIGLLGGAIADANFDGRRQVGPDDIFAVIQNQWPNSEKE